MVRGFPGFAGDVTALVGKLLWPVWAVARLTIHGVARIQGHKKKGE